MIRLAKRLFRLLRFLIWVTSVLLIAYILFNSNVFHNTKPLTEDKLRDYTRFLSTVNTNPYQYVATAFDKHSVVFLGELHKRKDDLEFLHKLIPFLVSSKNIRIIGWEFGAAEFQHEVDSIILASEFDRTKAVSVMRRSNYQWAYEDYLKVFETIWQLNKNIKDTVNKIQFLQLNKVYNPKNWNSNIDSVRLEERKSNFDNILPGIVEKKVLEKGQKILIYCGLNHSLTKFKTPIAFFKKDQSGRAGQRLFEKYPNQIFQICLLSPLPARWAVINSLVNKSTEFDSYVFPFEGVFNQLYDSLQKPFAVDASYPEFGSLKDYHSYYAFDKGNGLTLSEFTDGCIFLNSFDKIKGVDVVKDWIQTDGDFSAIMQMLPEEMANTISTKKQLEAHLGSDQNILSIVKIHQLEKFW